MPDDYALDETLIPVGGVMRCCLQDVAMKLSGGEAMELADWRGLSAAFTALALPEEHRDVKLWPNTWHRDCAAVAHYIDEQEKAGREPGDTSP